MKYKYINVSLERSMAKTDKWVITNKTNKVYLGFSKYSYPHKQYVFKPTCRHITYLSVNILNDILAFIKKSNKDRLSRNYLQVGGG